MVEKCGGGEGQQQQPMENFKWGDEPPATRKLIIGTYNPFGDVTTSTRVRQLLHTHQGRDKLFKVLQFTLRVYLWVKGTAIQSLTFIENANSSRFTVAERNYMTVLNCRRMFRIGRFVGEYVRLRVTLIRCSELINAPSTSTAASLFIQLQMIVDFTARILMLIKCICDDIAYISQKGFLHSQVATGVIGLSTRLGPPVLLTDLFLNTLKLVQGTLEARRLMVANNNNSKDAANSGSRQPSSETPPPPLSSYNISGIPVVEESLSLGASVAVEAALKKQDATPLPKGKQGCGVGEQPTPAKGGCVATTASTAASPTVGKNGKSPFPSRSFSLLAAYASLDKLRTEAGASSSSPAASQAPAFPPLTLDGVQKQSSALRGCTSSPRASCASQSSACSTLPGGGSGHHQQQLSHASSSDWESVSSKTPPPEGASVVAAPAGGVAKSEEEEEEAAVAHTTTDSYFELFWRDFELHWVMVTQIKLCLDCYVSCASLMQIPNIQGKTAVCGLVSGLLSVYRVWSYGR